MRRKERRVFALFKRIFLRNRSLSNARWFYGKKRKIGKGNLYLTENRLSWNEIFCAADNQQLYVSHMCKRIFTKELQLSSYWQNIKFSRNCPKFHIFTKFVIFKYICNFLDHVLHPQKFHGRDMSGILFFIFASCEPLIKQMLTKYEVPWNYPEFYIFTKMVIFLSLIRKKIDQMLLPYKFYGRDM